MNKNEKPWYKRWQVWLGVFVVLAILGAILPDPADNENVEVVNSAPEENEGTEKSETKEETKDKEVSKEVIPLSQDAVLDKFETDSDSGPYINGTFTFVGNRTDTADYYSLTDTEQFRNASIIFKDSQIARLKLIPNEGQNVNELFEAFGITDEPRKLSGMAGFYEVALIPMYWTQNIESYPYEQKD